MVPEVTVATTMHAYTDSSADDAWQNDELSYFSGSTRKGKDVDVFKEVRP